METLEQIGKEIIESKNSYIQSMQNIEETINNVLDDILFITKGLNKMNDGFITIFGLLDKASKGEITSDEDTYVLDVIINELTFLNLESSRLFAKISKYEIFRDGCKTAMLNFRANIRTLREYLEDLEERYLLADEEDGFADLMGSLI